MAHRKVRRKKQGEAGERVTLSVLAQDIAAEAQTSPKKVRTILQLLVQQTTEHLRRGAEVRLDGLGVLRVHRLAVNTQSLTTFTGQKKAALASENFRLSFSKSRVLKEKLMSKEDEGMDKFAVDETAKVSSEELEKRAASGCPDCGRALTKHGSVLLCPVHGSSPFER